MMAHLGRWLLFLVLGAFLAAPIAIVAGVSVNAAKTLQFPPEGFSLAWYADIVRDPGWRNALLRSVVIAACSAALAVLIAFPLVWAQWRRRSWLGQVFETLGLMPFILPPVITALGFLSFWATAGFYGAPWTVVISHAIFFVTLPLVTLTLGFASVDREIVEAAATMGADPRAILRTVILPLVGPYVLSGYSFAFVLSLNEYIVAYMVAGFTTETLPIKIFNALRYGYTPTMAAVTVAFVLLAVVVFGAVARFGDLPRLLGAWAPREK
jgi:putative spermidine/putrescine transport system permease protein